MPLIPLFIQNEVGAGDADLLSAFNFCNPFDHILPFSDGTVSDLDMQHLWGMATAIPVEITGAPGSLAPNLAYWFIKT